MAVRVFEVNDYEWWIGDCTPDELLMAYMVETNVSHEDATGDNDEYPMPLSERALDNLFFTDEVDGVKVRITFRERMQQMIAEGTPMPTCFASTES